MHHTFEVNTYGKGTYDITKEVVKFAEEHNIASGQCCVFSRHTSCSLVIMENGDPRSREDLEEYFERLVPEDTPYFAHTDEGPDDMPSHIRMVLTTPTCTIPVIDGKLMLGTWQSIYLFEHRKAQHRRKVILSIVGS